MGVGISAPLSFRQDVYKRQRISRTPWLWQLEERHLDSVQAMLERTYDVSGDGLAEQLTEVAGKLAEEYWTEHQQDFFYIVDGSFLEEYDEFNKMCIRDR